MATDTRQGTGELLAAVSNMVVGVYADSLGRGPTRARSYIDQDVVLCLLEDTLTKPERQLQGSGRGERVDEVRGALQQSMQKALVAGMEQLLGRRVKVLISGSQLDADIASEVFVLGGELTSAREDPNDPVLPDGTGPGASGNLKEEPA